MKKPFLGLLSLLSGCALFSGCGTLNNVMSLATGNSSRSFTFQTLPKTADDITFEVVVPATPEPSADPLWRQPRRLL